MSILKGLPDLEINAPVIEIGGDIQTHRKMILQLSSPRKNIPKPMVNQVLLVEYIYG